MEGITLGLPLRGPHCLSGLTVLSGGQCRSPTPFCLPSTPSSSATAAAGPRNLPPCLSNPFFNYSKIMLNPRINIAVASSEEFHYRDLGCRQNSGLRKQTCAHAVERDTQRDCSQNKKAERSFPSDRPEGRRNAPFHRLSGQRAVPPSPHTDRYFWDKTKQNSDCMKY